MASKKAMSKMAMLDDYEEPSTKSKSKDDGVKPMLVFIKYQKEAFGVEIKPTDKLSTLKARINERLGTKLQSAVYKLAFGGKQLVDESATLESFGIGKEATIHCILPKPISLQVEYNGVTETISVPLDKSVTIRDVARIIRNAFPSESAFARALPKVEYHSEILNDNKSVESCGFVEGDTIRAIKQEVRVEDPTQAEAIDEQTKEALLASFASDAKSSSVEIVFSFDTTGSMSACLGQVRAKVEETVQRLMKDIKNIKIGIINHGDYCDNTKAIDVLDLSDNVSKICKFIRTTASTSGGDSPECYEYALQTANELSWSDDASKALVVIGDEVPHPPSYTTENINWFDELDRLVAKGVKVYGVRALNCTYAIPFYQELSERSGTVSITFQNFNLIVDMFLAICYRESSPEQLAQFEAEVRQTKQVSEEMDTIFKTLAQPDPPKKEEKKEDKTTIVLKSNQPWYDLSADNGKPFYKRSGKGWTSVGGGMNPTPVYTPSYSTSSTSYYSPPTAIPHTTSAASSGSLKLVTIGDGAVGKTSLLIKYSSGSFPSEYVPSVFDNYSCNVMHNGKAINLGLWDTAGQEDYDRLRPLSYPGTDCFLICCSAVSPTSLQNIESRWIPEARHHVPNAKVVIVCTKTDLRSSTTSKVVSTADVMAMAGRVKADAFVECSSLTGDGVNEVFDKVKEVVLASSDASKKSAPSLGKKMRSLWRRSISLFA
eukprot:TRINITY_DN3468_c0_g1_i1.p1 TRINITY_DN3468_c0_g1~~TRINITY_DN3468_c0_g1_i1.p1  ORF type:complete len:716 (+),score=182.00 TRINITY_DN3468_c0_g1_i1:90-2237(+)